MARFLPAALVVALLAATTGAFVLTQGLKLTPSPIVGTRVPLKVFSPVCRCATDTAPISFRLREGDRITVEIVRGERAVRALLRSERRPRGRVELAWDGRDDSGRVVAEGVYRPRVRLLGERRTIVLPNDVRVDVTPPRVLAADVEPRVFSPDGDRRRDSVGVRWTFAERARGLLFVGGRRRVVTKFARARDATRWYGIVGGEPVRRGSYALSLRARDQAGNVGPAVPLGRVVVRFVALGRTRIAAVAGRRFAVRVSSDAQRVRWRLGGRSGTARPGTLRLQAPLQKGTFTLVVSANGHDARARVTVREAP